MTNVRKQRIWTIHFSENSEEYYGSLMIQARSCKRVDNKTLVADGVRIITDEYWTDELEDITEHVNRILARRERETGKGEGEG